MFVSNKVSNLLNTRNFPSSNTTTAEELEEGGGQEEMDAIGLLRLATWQPETQLLEQENLNKPNLVIQSTFVPHSQNLKRIAVKHIIS